MTTTALYKSTYLLTYLHHHHHHHINKILFQRFAVDVQSFSSVLLHDSLFLDLMVILANFVFHIFGNTWDIVPGPAAIIIWKRHLYSISSELQNRVEVLKDMLMYRVNKCQCVLTNDGIESIIRFVYTE